MKIITLCGSLKFQRAMMMVAEVMALKGNCILYRFKKRKSVIQIPIERALLRAYGFEEQVN